MVDGPVPANQHPVWQQAAAEGKVVIVHHPDTPLTMEVPEYALELTSAWVPQGMLYMLNPQLVWQGPPLW